MPAQTLGSEIYAIQAAPSQEQLQNLSKKRISPWIQGEQVTFIYQTPAKTVELAGELTRWHRKGLKLQKTVNNIHHITLRLPMEARLEYKYLVDSNWKCDPWNPLQCESGIGSNNSFLTMPKYQKDPLFKATTPLPDQGTIKSYLLKDDRLGKRKLHVYLPPDYSDAHRYPVLYIQDGEDYLNRGELPKLLNILHYEKRISPAIAVFIEPIERFREYTLNPAYCELLTKTLVPWVDQHFSTRRHPRSRILVGSSLGGLISTYLAYHYAHIFGQVLGQSSSYQYYGERLVHTLQNLQTHPIRLYLSAGQFEGLVQANRRMKTVLSQKGYDFKYDEYAEGHNWSHWKHRLSKGLEYLLGNENYD